MSVGVWGLTLHPAAVSLGKDTCINAWMSEMVSFIVPWLEEQNGSHVCQSAPGQVSVTTWRTVKAALQNILFIG